ncbi:MAG: BlaI/MecI/CopY family transcriptional regulator [Candidatus Aenigmarchaeota archaeon]|nr:BlaI/MecI/CopY family transcriptional regulator [Candidatus Aenigmarchaeota archaeon]
MIQDGLEKEVLEEIARRMLVKKEELVLFLENKVENPVSTVETIVKLLIDKGLVTYVEVIGKTCYAITQKGIREINESNKL